MTSEASIERYLREEITKRRGWCIKLASYTDTGIPDRLVLLPGDIPRFVELKSATGRLRPAQVRAIERLRDLGTPVLIIRSREEVDEWLAVIDEDRRNFGCED